MKILTQIPEIYGQKTAVMLGNFDGFHRAHKRLAEETVAYAHAHGLTPAAFTLTSPPNKGTMLTTQEEKIAFLQEAGIEVLFSYDFSQVKDLSCREFCEKLLFGTFCAEALFCGFNYRFGKGRAGDANTLSELCKGKARVFVLPAMKDKNGEVISSSKIRSLIEEGNIPQAEELLGHKL